MAINKTDAPLIIYNNIILGEPVNLEVEANPVYSETGTNELKYVEHTLTVQTYISGDTTQNTFLANPDGLLTPTGLPDYAAGRTDDVMTLIKGAIMVPGRTFYLCNSGYGNLVVRGDELGGTTLSQDDLEAIAMERFETVGEFKALYGQRDINFGPKPNLLKWEPIGGRNAARVVWEIKLYTQECLLWHDDVSGFNALGRILEFNFSQEWSLDRQFLTTRTVTGKVTISNNLLMRQDRTEGGFALFDGTVVPPLLTGSPGGNNNLYKFISENANSLRDTILFWFISPPYFRRTKQTFVENENNTELKFTIVDEEINSQDYWPTQCIDIDMTHDTTADISSGFQVWTNNLSGTITLNAGVPYSRALVIFGTLCVQRFIMAPGAVIFNVPIKPEGNEDGKGTYELTTTQIPLNIRISEKIFTDNSRFEFSFSWTSVIPYLVPTVGGKLGDTPLFWWENLGLFTGVIHDNHSWENYETSIVGNGIGSSKYDNRGQAKLSYEWKILSNPCNDLTQGTFAVAHNTHHAPSWNPKGPPAYARPFGNSLNELVDTGEKPQMPNDEQTGSTWFGSVFTFGTFLARQGWSVIKQKLETKLNTIYNNTMPFIKSVIEKVGGQSEPDDKAYIPNEREHHFISSPSSQGTFDGSGLATRIIERGAPSITATVTGEVVRAGGPHPAPRVTKIGGAIVQLMNEDYSYEEVSSGVETAIYKSSFVQTYLVLGQPENVANLEGEGLILGSVSKIT